VKPRLLPAALIFAVAIHVFAMVNETQAPAAPDLAPDSQASAPAVGALPPASSAGRLPTVAPDTHMAAFVASTPFPTFEVASLPRRDPELTPAAVPIASPMPSSERPVCDPAYPDEDTCIPPGPPFDQGCAITAERRFTVLPPDPQGLDHDSDGIGCEPIR
jgi:hypothetical protein